MELKERSTLTDQELIDQAKKLKSTTIIHAVLIGMMIGIIVYSIIVNSIGFLTLIPLAIAFKLAKKPDNAKELKQLLKERNLKY